MTTYCVIFNNGGYEVIDADAYVKENGVLSFWTKRQPTDQDASLLIRTFRASEVRMVKRPMELQLEMYKLQKRQLDRIIELLENDALGLMGSVDDGGDIL